MKKILFDTSILVAGFSKPHPKHTEAVKLIDDALDKKIKMVASTHTIAECYSVLTRLPVSFRIEPQITARLIRENIESCAKIISLAASDYLSVIKALSSENLSGGLVYDALIIRAAEKEKVNEIVTLNGKDFKRLSKNIKVISL